MTPFTDSAKTAASPRTQGIANVLASVSRMYGEAGRRRRQAVALEQAGYAKRRTLTTLEEVHEMPNGSTIRINASGAVMGRFTGGWHTPAIEDRSIPNESWVPMIVLWDPRDEENS